MEYLPHSHEYREQLLYKFCTDFMKDWDNFYKKWQEETLQARQSRIMTWLDKHTSVTTRTKKDYLKMFLAQVPEVFQSEAIGKPVKPWQLLNR